MRPCNVTTYFRVWGVGTSHASRSSRTDREKQPLVSNLNQTWWVIRTYKKANISQVFSNRRRQNLDLDYVKLGMQFLYNFCGTMLPFYITLCHLGGWGQHNNRYAPRIRGTLRHPTCTPHASTLRRRLPPHTGAASTPSSCLGRGCTVVRCVWTETIITFFFSISSTCHVHIFTIKLSYDTELRYFT